MPHKLHNDITGRRFLNNCTWSAILHITAYTKLGQPFSKEEGANMGQIWVIITIREASSKDEILSSIICNIYTLNDKSSKNRQKILTFDP